MSFREKIGLLALALILIHVEAWADPVTQMLRSEYHALTPWDTSLRTIVVGETEELVAADIIVSSPRCNGWFSGIGAVENGQIVIRSYKPQEAWQNCVLTIKLTAKGKTAEVSEENCSGFHGASCSFEGTLKAK